MDNKEIYTKVMQGELKEENMSDKEKKIFFKEADKQIKLVKKRLKEIEKENKKSIFNIKKNEVMCEKIDEMITKEEAKKNGK